jgi:hypothetical protein
MLSTTRGIAHPKQLAMLTKALQDYCREAGIEPGTPAYEDAGCLVMSLFQDGVSTAEELADALRVRIPQH